MENYGGGGGRKPRGWLSYRIVFIKLMVLGESLDKTDGIILALATGDTHSLPIETQLLRALKESPYETRLWALHRNEAITLLHYYNIHDIH